MQQTNYRHKILNSNEIEILYINKMKMTSLRVLQNYILYAETAVKFNNLRIYICSGASVLSIRSE